MSGFMGGGKPTAATPTAYTGLQLPTSTATVAVPLLFGRQRVAPNYMWSGNFYSVAQSSGGGGGKGGGGSQQVNGYLYYVDIIMGVCEVGEGAVTSLQTWESDGTVYGSISQWGLSLADGSQTVPWSYVTGAAPGQALTYAGVSYLYAHAYNLGSMAAIPQRTYEIQRPPTPPDAVYSGPTVALSGDALPAAAVADFLCHPAYGVSTIFTQLLDRGALATNPNSYHAYTCAAGFLISPLVSSQEPARSVVARWLQLTNSYAFWSEGLLKIIPYGGAPLSTAWSAIIEGGTGNATYAPNISVVWAFTDDDYLHDPEDDPLLVTRVCQTDTYNIVRVECHDRGGQSAGETTVFADQPAGTGDYAGTICEARDDGDIALYGPRPMGTVTAHEICDIGVGALVAQALLQRNVGVRNTYKFKLSWEFLWLDPGDLVALTDSALGLSEWVVRITAIEEDDQGLLAVTAEDYADGAAELPAATGQPAQGGAAFAQGAPVAVNPPLIFEPPLALCQSGAPEVWVCLSWPAIVDTGAQIWLSVDGDTYGLRGTLAQPAPLGALTAPLAAGATPDMSDSLCVTIAQSVGTRLISDTLAGAQLGTTLSYISDGVGVGECLAYATATLTGPGAYSLTGLARGLDGTAGTSHASGAPFVRLDGSQYVIPLPQAYIGVPISFKFPAITAAGEIQSLADVPAYIYTPCGRSSRVVPPTALSGTGIGGAIQLSWSPSPTAGAVTDVYGLAGVSTDFAAATLLGTVGAGGNGFLHTGLSSGEIWTYWVVAGKGSLVSAPDGPVSATAGLAPVTAIDLAAATSSYLTAASFSGDLAPFGCVQLPDGLIFQWGEITVGDGLTRISFDSAFPTACFVVIPAAAINAAAAAEIVGYQDWNQTGFTVSKWGSFTEYQSGQAAFWAVGK